MAWKVLAPKVVTPTAGSKNGGGSGVPSITHSISVPVGYPPEYGPVRSTAYCKKSPPEQMVAAPGVIEGVGFTDTVTNTLSLLEQPVPLSNTVTAYMVLVEGPAFGFLMAGLLKLAPLVQLYDNELGGKGENRYPLPLPGHALEVVVELLNPFNALM